MRFQSREPISFEKIWRGRLGGEEIADKIAKFISCVDIDSKIAEIDIRVLQAHSISLYKRGYIEKDKVKKILVLLERLKEDFRANKINLDYKYIDIHPIIEDYIIKKGGIDVGGQLNLGKSRNDQISTDLRIYTREKLLSLIDTLLNFILFLVKKAENFIYLIMPVYTHTQPAQISTYAHYLLCFVDKFLRDVDRLFELYNRVNLLPLGASAIAGSSLEIDREYLAELLGFDGILENTIDAVSSRDFILEFINDICLIAINISSLSEDIILFTTKEYGYFELSNAVADVSSAMPHKKNPCPVEMLRAKTSYFISALVHALSLVKSLPTGYNKDLQELKIPLFNCAEEINTCISILQEIMDNININQERLKETCKDFILSLDIAEYLVKKGIVKNFREAHNLVGNIIKECLDKGVDFLTSLKERLGEISGLEDILSEPLKSIEERKNLLGSPASKQVKSMLKERHKKIQALFSNLDEYNKKLKYKEEKMENIIKNLV